MLADSMTTQAFCEVKWCFGGFVLWEAQRRVERRGERIRLGWRSFDLLVQFMKRPGEVISKEELLACVWSGVVVEEASVRVHMSILRKALGEPEPFDDCQEWIVTVPLRGYRFVGRVHRQAADRLSDATPGSREMEALSAARISRRPDASRAAATPRMIVRSGTPPGPSVSSGRRRIGAEKSTHR